jgi:hypothetical protein
MVCSLGKHIGFAHGFARFVMKEEIEAGKVVLLT